MDNNNTYCQRIIWWRVCYARTCNIYDWYVLMTTTVQKVLCTMPGHNSRYVNRSWFIITAWACSFSGCFPNQHLIQYGYYRQLLLFIYSQSICWKFIDIIIMCMSSNFSGCISNQLYHFCFGQLMLSVIKI